MPVVQACSPSFTADSVVACIVGAGAVMAALTALGIQVARNVRDIRAAWAQIHIHEKVLNGAVKAAKEGQEP